MFFLIIFYEKKVNDFYFFGQVRLLVLCPDLFPTTVSVLISCFIFVLHTVWCLIPSTVQMDQIEKIIESVFIFFLQNVQ